MRRTSRLSGRPLGVAALVLCVGACSSTVVTTDRVARRVTVSPSAAPAIDRLEITEPEWRPDGSDWRLELTWAATGTRPFDHYEAWRNGEVVDESIESAAWTDRNVEPGTRYRYAVVGVTVDGSRTLPERSAIITDTPPVADARLEGSFVMVMHADTSEGVDDPVDGGKVVFRFDPVCGRGACTTRWTVHDRATEMTLTREGATYAGRDHTPLLIRNCLGDEIDERVRARFRVVEAASREGRWRAMEIDGSIAERSAWRGCMVASIRWTVHGVLR
ncbi:MAG TPA: hypothetical protein VI341_02115 [Actinomycetota bacterium]